MLLFFKSLAWIGGILIEFHALLSCNPKPHHPRSESFPRTLNLESLWSGALAPKSRAARQGEQMVWAQVEWMGSCDEFLGFRVRVWGLGFGV